MDYRLVQDGIVVAEISGPDERAQAEMAHYAVQYSQAGPVGIERLVGKNWEPVLAYEESKPCLYCGGDPCECGQGGY